MTHRIHPSRDPAHYPRPGMSPLPVIDLFAGAGGFGIAAQTAGADLRLSVELDPIACVTLKQNSSANHRIVEADVSEVSGADLRSWALLDDSDPLVIVGGAPCQPFSKAAYWVEEGKDAAWRRDRADGITRTRPPAPTQPRADDRRSLVEHFVRLVVESEADGFVFENVTAIQHPRNRPMLDGLVSTAEAEGFSTQVVRALASDYGVAQHRERVFVLGSKRTRPVAPTGSHDGRALGKDDLLAPVPAEAVCKPYSGPEFYEPEEVVSGRWAEKLSEIPAGWNYKWHTAWAGHPSPAFVAEQRFWNFLLVLDPSKPSWTIPANPGPWVGPFHWEHRRLRTPESAAIQGFPDGYAFAGTRRERVRQIGNAVPPPMAARMVTSVLDSLGAAAS